jgi:hypothetical protein
MNLLFKLVYFALMGALLVYVSLPSPAFPQPPPKAIQSLEPGDTETPLRRAYFVDQDRDEVINHYRSQFKQLPTLRLNYPPEEAQTFVRDQTRSSYLEELVHPIRESIYINGFVPKEKKDAIVIEGREYYQKLTVRYVPSNIVVRVLFVLLISLLGYFLIIFSASLMGQYLAFIKGKVWKLKHQ